MLFIIVRKTHTGHLSDGNGDGAKRPPISGPGNAIVLRVP